MCDVDVRWQYTGRTRAGGRTSRPRASERPSVGRYRARELRY